MKWIFGFSFIHICYNLIIRKLVIKKLKKEDVSMKKLLTSLLCASMAVGLSACGGGNSVPATTAAPASQAESAGETSSEAAEAAEAPAS